MALGYAFALMVVAVMLQWLLTSQAVASLEVARIIIRILQTLLVSGALVMVVVVAFRYTGARKAFYDRVRAYRADQVARAVNDLPLVQLFRLNRRQLDEYHVLSVRQASISFRNATIASAVAFLILVFGALIAIQPTQDDSSRYIAGGLSALGATLSAFLSRNFFSSYKETAKQLRDYYEEPARTGRILALERLAMNPGQKGALHTDLQKLLVEALLEDYHKPAPSDSEPDRRKDGAAAENG